MPGPEVFDHVVVRVFDGRPSSDAVPVNDTPAGSVIDWSAPAFTCGAWFTGPPPPGGTISYIFPSFSLGALSLSTPRSTM